MLDFDFEQNMRLEDIYIKNRLNQQLLNKVKCLYPDAKLVGGITCNKFYFESTGANKNWNHLSWSKKNGGLWTFPSHKLTTSYLGTQGDVHVRCSPKKILLLKKQYRLGKSALISFPKTKDNLKKNGFDEDKLYNLCKHKIINYINFFSDCELDKSQADERITKILTIM